MIVFGVGLSSDEVSAIIVACGGVIVGLLALIGVAIPFLVSLLRRTKRVEAHTKETVEQVSNDHSTNFRVENDERHAETTAALAKLDATIRSNDRRAGRRNAATNRRIDKLADRLDVVEENTIDPRTIRRRTK